MEGLDLASQYSRSRNRDKQSKDGFNGLALIQLFSVLQFPLHQDWLVLTRS